MDTSEWRTWLIKRLEIADHIVRKFGRVAHEDAEILLCCEVSSVAAFMWPGRGIDEVRYVEFLVRFSRSIPPVTLISVPTLVADLQSKGDSARSRGLIIDADELVARSRELVNSFYPGSNSRVLTYAEADRDEPTVAGALPVMQSCELRRASYAVMIYKDLRSGLVHEHRPTDRLSSFPMSQREDVPSYFNWIPEAGRPERVLFFPYDYIRDVVVTASQGAFDFWDKADSWNQPFPAKWWIHGK